MFYLRILRLLFICLAPLQDVVWMYVPQGRRYMVSTVSQYREWASLYLLTLSSDPLVSKVIPFLHLPCIHICIPQLWQFIISALLGQSAEDFPGPGCPTLAFQSSLPLAVGPEVTTWSHLCHIRTNLGPRKTCCKASSCWSNRPGCQVAFTKRWCIGIQVGLK